MSAVPDALSFQEDDADVKRVRGLVDRVSQQAEEAEAGSLDVHELRGSMAQLVRTAIESLAPDSGARRSRDVARALFSESPVLQEALRRAAAACARDLGAAGLPTAAIDTLQAWMEMVADAQLLRVLLASQPEPREGSPAAGAAETPTQADPVTPLSAQELGTALGNFTDQTVRQRERDGKLFSILRPGRKRGAEYPAFQAWDGIKGEPLERVLRTLFPEGTISGPSAYGFFTSPSELLAGLSPVEALTGTPTRKRDVGPAARELLSAPHGDRLDAVLAAAAAERDADAAAGQ